MSIAKPDLGPSDPENMYTTNKRRKPTSPDPEPEPLPRSHVLNGGGRPRVPKNLQQRIGERAPKSNKQKSFSGPTSLPAEDPYTDPFSSTLALAKSRNATKLQPTSLYGGGTSSFSSYAAQLKIQKRGEKKMAPLVHYVRGDSSVDGGIELPPNGALGKGELGSYPMDLSDDEPDAAFVGVTIRGGRGLTAAEASARAFHGREYTTAPTPPPRQTFFRDPIKVDSKQAIIWSANQANSPLLRLPRNVRDSIYRYTLGGNTIEVSYMTYLNGKVAGGKFVSVPFHKYASSVYYGECNPFTGTISEDISHTYGMTMLTLICRQLYLETYVLPYSLNKFYFVSVNTLFNFLVMEDPPRLQPKQREVFKSIVVLHKLPVPAILDMLPNLESVRLVKAEVAGETGYYRVVKEGKERKLVKDTALRKPTMRGGSGGHVNPRAGYRYSNRNSHSWWKY
ncbi:hypothetical protein BU23DRAFT_556427 [Bimuria novae-zelandiae CBS 107.79]|uniref:DUF7730 domain-containing protein n=1 Tax=Bimuria novae-zelandiae CBS 107.79 TaxID=1447943 RepID=A0A6A5VCF5_9PLEO|nr:hypothetical protein BU23DRAFT_556427 [Bimuria novae-zelandiae CBS 107.79]